MDGRLQEDKGLVMSDQNTGGLRSEEGDETVSRTKRLERRQP